MDDTPLLKSWWMNVYFTAPVAGSGVGPAEQLGILEQTWEILPVHWRGCPSSVIFFIKVVPV